MYLQLMEYIDSVFEDTLAPRVEREGPVAPGTNFSSSCGELILFNRTSPVHYIIEQANRDYLKAVETSYSFGYLIDQVSKTFTWWRGRKLTAQQLR